MNGVVACLKLDRKRFADAADYLAIALVASLPWSTSATGILVVTWLVVLLPTLNWPALRREIATAAGGLPVLLVALAALGTLWADVAWSERAAGLVSYLKLLVIPLLFVQFRRSERGLYAIYALLIAGALLLAASYLSTVFPGRLPDKGHGVVVKDYISQSGFFTLCLFMFADLAFQAWRNKRYLLAGCFASLCAAFLGNMVYVVVGRTALLVIPVLLILYGLRKNWKMALVAGLAFAAMAALAWMSSPYLRARLAASPAIQTPGPMLEGITFEPSSNALRLAFWSASVGIVKQAPLLGHGTGSIRSQFQQYGTAHPGSFVEHASNPHNQTFAVGIQLGVVGVAVLFAMWLAHLLVFRGAGFAAWFGCVIVVQNIVGSLANSHIFDFAQGWTYAICVGVAGGMARRRDVVSAADRAPHHDSQPPPAEPENPDTVRLHANSSDPVKRPL
jgi:O-antigen ligase